MQAQTGTPQPVQQAPAPNPALNSILSSLPADQAAELRARAANVDAGAAKIENLGSQAQGVLGQMQQLPKIAAPKFADISALPPSVPSIEPVKAFQNVGVVLALFGSLLTRAPLTSAFKTGAAAMQAYNNGEIQKYQMLRQTWHDQMDQALQQNQVELDKYNAAITGRGQDMTELQAEMTQIATQSRDVQMLTSLQTGQHDEAIQLLQNRQKMQLELAKTSALAGLRSERESLGRATLAERTRHDKAMEGVVAGKAGAKLTSSILDTKGDIQDLAKLDKFVAANPGVVGAWGNLQRHAQGIFRQVPIIGGDVNGGKAAEFGSMLEALRARLTKSYLEAHYYTANSAEAMDTLLKGLGNLDDDTSVRYSFKVVGEKLQEQMAHLRTMMQMQTDYTEAGTAAMQNQPTGGTDALPNYDDMDAQQLLQSEPQ